MTSTVIVNESIGTGANVGNGLFATKAILAAATTAYVISARLTPGAGHCEGRVRVYYTTTAFDISAANGPAQLAQTTRYLDLTFNPSQPEVPVIRDGSLEPATGYFLHVWVEVPPQAVASTLELAFVELP